MYLTSAQHDQLRTLIMGFEIPYRSYIAEVILDTYHDKCSFSTALTNAQLSNCQPVLNNTIKNQIIKAQKIRTNSLMHCSLQITLLRQKVLQDQQMFPC